MGKIKNKKKTLETDKKLRKMETEESKKLDLIIKNAQLGLTLSLLILIYSVSGTAEPILTQEEDQETYYNQINNSLDPLFFTKEDVDYLNRIYGEYRNETAYCGVKNNGVVEVEIATMTESNLKSVSSLRHECSYPYGTTLESERRVDMHTHPVGADEFSDADLEHLLQSHSKHTCIQYGEIKENNQGVVEGLRCTMYEGQDSIEEDFRDIPVQILNSKKRVN